MKKLDLETLNMISGGSEIIENSDKPVAYCKECKAWVTYEEKSGGRKRGTGSCTHFIDDSQNPRFK